MGQKLTRYQNVVEEPLPLRVRVVLLLSLFLLIWIFRAPLWTMAFESNQYPDPLRLAIYINHLEGQKTELRDDLREINSLNHYIGMRPLLESDFAEFLWMPFVLGGLALLLLLRMPHQRRVGRACSRHSRTGLVSNSQEVEVGAGLCQLRPERPTLVQRPAH